MRMMISSESELFYSSELLDCPSTCIVDSTGDCIATTSPAASSHNCVMPIDQRTGWSVLISTFFAFGSYVLDVETMPPNCRT